MILKIYNSSKNKKGMSLIVAVFMIVVFSFIGITLVSILSTQSTSSSQELLSTQALFLAESGVEIAIADNLSDNLSADNDTYILGNGKIELQIDNIGNIPGDPAYSDLYKVESTGSIGDIKRKIAVKYKR
ncbi:MAG: hypothetical protein FXF49_06285 [Flexistipes sinusarabici]|uniref:Type 4 fimbrial biogenesis protein PilX N-terminal domain-containing protein n=1 Tax=Flexistipes sinusarabici TaxID=2352 RepID=A0A5D0MIE0_FLESI|nr:hypothetical protein [Flexistipes sinusarabici]TYB33447.1 MAG: hypothetical protein FXF49_06285 [Flexistipes sinusarabici]